jgi:hypothetical protein
MHTRISIKESSEWLFENVSIWVLWVHILQISQRDGSFPFLGDSFAARAWLSNLARTEAVTFRALM